MRKETMDKLFKEYGVNNKVDLEVRMMEEAKKKKPWVIEPYNKICEALDRGRERRRQENESAERWEEMITIIGDGISGLLGVTKKKREEEIETLRYKLQKGMLEAEIEEKAPQKLQEDTVKRAREKWQMVIELKRMEKEIESMVNNECIKMFGADNSKWTIDQHKEREEMVKQMKHIMETELARDQMGKR
jgi:hypothetical protein